MEFKDRLSQLRTEASLSQAELAQRVGVSVGAIGNYESGVRLPNQEIADRMAELFNVPVADLLRGPVLTRTQYAAFADAVNEALDHTAEDDAKILGIDERGVRRALAQRLPIREDRARELASTLALNYDVVMREALKPGEAWFEAQPIEELAAKLYNNPKTRLLMSVSEGLKDEDLELVTNMAQKLRQNYNNE